MSYRAVALSQVDGAGGESIGHEIAEKLGFTYLNESVVARVAQDQGVDLAAVTSAEQRKPFFDRLLEAAAGSGMGDTVADWPQYAVDQTDQFLALIRNAVRDAAERGNVVLVAHAASYACADRPDVLRVCITAPLSVRASRLAVGDGITDKEAARFLRRSDLGRASYLKRVYGVDKESPTDYDLVINTARLAADAAVSLVLKLVGAGPARPAGPDAEHPERA
jgi:cytidylate kinase